MAVDNQNVYMRYFVLQDEQEARTLRKFENWVTISLSIKLYDSAFIFRDDQIRKFNDLILFIAYLKEVMDKIVTYGGGHTSLDIWETGTAPFTATPP